MIIENAFFKLTEILSKTDQKYLEIKENIIYESALSHYFALAIISEFNSRNVLNPFLRIQAEKLYPKNNKNPCDLYVSLKGLYDKVFRENYKIYEDNYCEIKYFKGYNITPKNQAQTITENIGYILNDISRLVNYTNPDSGKYFMVFFDSDKWNYLGKEQKTSKNKRPWLNKIFCSGFNSINFNLDEEFKSLKNKIKTNQKDFCLDIQTLEINTYPRDKYYNGYLIKILN